MCQRRIVRSDCHTTVAGTSLEVYHCMVHDVLTLLTRVLLRCLMLLLLLLDCRVFQGTVQPLDTGGRLHPNNFTTFTTC